MIYFIDQLTNIAFLTASIRDTIATVIAVIKHLLAQESYSPWFIQVEKIDTDDYEDYWTQQLAVHLVELSDGRRLPILCESPSQAWNKIEAWLLSKDDFHTSILKITRDEW